MRLIIVTLCFALMTNAVAKDNEIDDPYLWLEDVTGEKALHWVESYNSKSLDYLQNLRDYESLLKRNLEIINSSERIPNPDQRGQHVFNFWRDDKNQRGLWRRATTANFISGNPQWEILLDLDKLAEEEKENWVWKGSDCLRPDYTRCLLNLSRGGADATVVREFDLNTLTFVADGFYLPEAKGGLSWLDQDTVYVGTDFGEGSLTDSGYPRLAKIWKRGSALADAETIFAGDTTDVSVSAYRTWDDAVHYDFLHQAPGFFKSKNYLIRNGKQIAIDIPEDARLRGIVLGQLLVEIKSGWAVAEHSYPTGSLLSIDFEKFLSGKRDFQVLLTPGKKSAIDSVTETRSFLIVNELNDVTNSLRQFRLHKGRWIGETIKTEPMGSISITSSDDTTDTFFFTYEGFLSPDTLYVAEDGGKSVKAVKALPAFFDTADMQVQQHFTKSADGTLIPYFLVTPKDFKNDGSTPTLLYGYGGFEISEKPFYSASIGESWLARGGAFVLANIRGGGEYGPDWHLAALREHRQRAYDDFIAIAEDLIKRKVTTPKHLGIWGGSNGGLLMGVMLTQRPELFGAIVCQVPLLDMQRYSHMLAGASWMSEYGDPDTDDWDFISKYSPYQNIKEGMNYPKVFFTTSTRDDRVHPGHARKMVAKLSAEGYDLLYYENTEGGHAGAADNEQQAKVQSLTFSYLWDQLGEEAIELTMR